MHGFSSSVIHYYFSYFSILVNSIFIFSLSLVFGMFLVIVSFIGIVCGVGFVCVRVLLLVRMSKM